MKPNKPAVPPVTPAPKKRFRVQKLEERIAPKKVKEFTWRCRPSW